MIVELSMKKISRKPGSTIFLRQQWHNTHQTKNRTASLWKLSWSRTRIRTIGLCLKSSWMKKLRCRECRGLPRWLCGCRRFPGKFTACSQITSMIHFVLREKITRAAPDEVCHQSKFWEPGNEARGVQLIPQNTLMSHVVPTIKPVDNYAALEMDERQPHPRRQNLVERAVQLPAPCCAVRWLSCSCRDNAMMWWTLWVEMSSFQTRLNTLAASLRRNIVDPGFLLIFFILNSTIK